MRWTVMVGILSMVQTPDAVAAESAPAAVQEGHRERRRAEVAAPPGLALPSDHEMRRMEGWSVRVDRRLLDPARRAEGERALRMLEAQLGMIALVVPEPALARLREVPIQIDLDHGNLRPMQYHPSADWLKANGYSTNLEKCVHIPRVDDFASPSEFHRMPWAVLHELAHAYHDRVLGFDEPRIRALYGKVKASGRLDSVLRVDGRKARHYALTDHKELFAEMTESYFGVNDFFPFLAAELQQTEPETYALLREIWGPRPGRR